jgi:cation diffusion facilitator family transporter
MGQSCCEKKGDELAFLRNRQSYVLKIVLVINAVMFVVEFISGVISKSSALTADSLDMLGDAMVYGFSLYVLYRNQHWKAKAALFKGLTVVGFAVFVLYDTTIKIFSTTTPIAESMGIVGLMALAANSACLMLLLKHRHDDINMRSTFICSRNDIISNTGVLIAAALVGYTGSKWPDIVIGFIIAILFFKSAWMILKDSIAHLKAPIVDHA